MPINPTPVPEELKFTPFPEQVQPSKKKKYSVILIIGLIMLIIFGISMFVLIKGNEDKIQSLKHLTPEMLMGPGENTPNIDDTKITLALLQQELEINHEIKEFKYNDWVMPDKTKTFIKGFAFSIDKGPPNVNEEVKNLSRNSEDFFISNGFNINIINSADLNMNSVFMNREVTLTKAYEKNGLFCVSSFDYAGKPFAVFYCAVIDQEQNKLQDTIGRELIPILNPKNKDDIQILILDVDNDLAIGIVKGSTDTGIKFYAKRINEEWKILEKTQKEISCSIAQEYNLKQKYLDNCTKN